MFIESNHAGSGQLSDEAHTTPAAPARTKRRRTIVAKMPSRLLSASASVNETTANAIVSPLMAMPSSRKTKAGRATVGALPTLALPGQHNTRDDLSSSDTLADGVVAVATGGEGHLTKDTQAKFALSATCDQLRELQTQRKSCVKGMNKINLQQLSLARRALGFDPDADAKVRAKVNKQAQALVRAIVKGQRPDDLQSVGAADACRVLVLALQQAITPLETYRKQLEKTMTTLAIKLPLREFVENTHGFGFFGLAIVIGEAGNLSNYANPGKLWKRMGLAVFHGKSQRKTTDADDAILQGYNPVRRSAMWTIGDSLLKKQNEYRELYLTRKAYEADRPETKSKMHAHRKAQRYAEKRFLLNLWKAWKAA
jgi:hypothetical protein